MNFEQLLNKLNDIYNNGCSNYDVKVVGHPGEYGTKIKEDEIIINHDEKAIYIVL